jgi:DNA ligase-1
LGLVIEHLFKKKPVTLVPKKVLSIEDVYEQLIKLAKISGGGSVDQKINLLAGLFSNCSQKEALYIARFVLGRLRLGVGDPTIMESLSKAFTEGREFRIEIERAYNLCSDLGLVAKTLAEKGENAIRKFEIKVGSPIRMALAARLPSAEDILEKIGKCAIETKYDGLRLAIHKSGNDVEIFSRNQERMTPMFPDIVEGIRKQVQAKNAIIEGEAVALNEDTGELFPFQVTITRKRKYEIAKQAKEFPLILFSFDLLYADGKDLTQEPYEKRIEKMHKIIKKGGTIKTADRIITDKIKEIEKFFYENVEKGAEGIIAKRLDGVYQAGSRNFNWIKLKRSYRGELQDTIDVVIVGYIKGRGARAKFGIGALLGSVYDEKTDDFKTIAKIGSGLSEEKWVEIKRILDKNNVDKKPARVDSVLEADVWVHPKIVFTVMADEITKSPVHTAGKKDDEPGFALRFPRIQGWIRIDKKPEDATSVKEIADMFKQQKKIKSMSFNF